MAGTDVQSEIAELGRQLEEKDKLLDQLKAKTKAFADSMRNQVAVEKSRADLAEKALKEANEREDMLKSKTKIFAEGAKAKMTEQTNTIESLLLWKKTHEIQVNKKIDEDRVQEERWKEQIIQYQNTIADLEKKLARKIDEIQQLHLPLGMKNATNNETRNLHPFPDDFHTPDKEVEKRKEDLEMTMENKELEKDLLSVIVQLREEKESFRLEVQSLQDDQISKIHSLENENSELNRLLKECQEKLVKGNSYQVQVSTDPTHLINEHEKEVFDDTKKLGDHTGDQLKNLEVQQSKDNEIGSLDIKLKSLEDELQNERKRLQEVQYLLENAYLGQEETQQQLLIEKQKRLDQAETHELEISAEKEANLRKQEELENKKKLLELTLSENQKSTQQTLKLANSQEKKTDQEIQTTEIVVVPENTTICSSEETNVYAKLRTLEDQIQLKEKLRREAENLAQEITRSYQAKLLDSQQGCFELEEKIKQCEDSVHEKEGSPKQSDMDIEEIQQERDTLKKRIRVLADEMDTNRMELLQHETIKKQCIELQLSVASLTKRCDMLQCRNGELQDHMHRLTQKYEESAKEIEKLSLGVHPEDGGVGGVGGAGVVGVVGVVGDEAVALRDEYASHLKRLQKEMLECQSMRFQMEATNEYWTDSQEARQQIGLQLKEIVQELLLHCPNDEWDFREENSDIDFMDVMVQQKVVHCIANFCRKQLRNDSLKNGFQEKPTSCLLDDHENMNTTTTTTTITTTKNGEGGSEENMTTDDDDDSVFLMERRVQSLQDFQKFLNHTGIWISKMNSRERMECGKCLKAIESEFQQTEVKLEDANQWITRLKEECRIEKNTTEELNSEIQHLKEIMRTESAIQFNSEKDILALKEERSRLQEALQHAEIQASDVSKMLQQETFRCDEIQRSLTDAKKTNGILKADSLRMEKELQGTIHSLNAQMVQNNKTLAEKERKINQLSHDLQTEKALVLEKTDQFKSQKSSYEVFQQQVLKEREENLDKKRKMKAFVDANTSQKQEMEMELHRSKEQVQSLQTQMKETIQKMTEKSIADQQEYELMKKSLQDNITSLKKKVAEYSIKRKSLESESQLLGLEMEERNKQVSQELQEKESMIETHKMKRLTAKAETQKLAKALEDARLHANAVMDSTSAKCSKQIALMKTMLNLVEETVSRLNKGALSDETVTSTASNMLSPPRVPDTPCFAVFSLSRIDTEISRVTDRLVALVERVEQLCELATLQMDITVKEIVARRISNAVSQCFSHNNSSTTMEYARVDGNRTSRTSL